MQSALSLTLIVSMLATTLLAAQEQTDTLESFDLRGPATPTAAGPLATAMMREAVRLAGTDKSATSAIGAGPQGAKPVESDWSRVRILTPGTQIIVTAKGSPSVTLYFLTGDESNLTVLNIADWALRDAERDVLRHVAATHPEYFPAAQKGGRFVLEKNVRLGPEGLFVAERKVADLAQVVWEYERRDVAEIRIAKIGSNPVGCALAGYYQGAVIGGLPGVLIGGAVGRDTGPALLGMMVGWSTGSVYAYRKCRHRPEQVIYRAR